MAPEREERDVDWAIALAINEAVMAGVYRRAQRLVPKSAATYGRLAAPYTQRAATLLGEACERLGV